MIAAAYWPALRAGFVWDDDAYVTANPLLTEPDGLWRIWFSAHRQSQYFPLTFTVLRFEHALWGPNPVGYHAVNVLLHCLNALLVWTLLRRLAVPGAWLAACIFALHPVQVETVAWVTEIKNLLSTFFYLLALLAWLRFSAERGKGGGRVCGPIPLTQSPAHSLTGTASPWRFYALALVLYSLALLSKTTACTLPAALALIEWWKARRLALRSLVQLAPFLALGLGMGLVSVWWEGHLGSYQHKYGLTFSLVERVLIASRALWFYAAKILWPVGLSFSYPHWDIRANDPLQYLWLLGCLVVATFLIRSSRREEALTSPPLQDQRQSEPPATLARSSRRESALTSPPLQDQRQSEPSYVGCYESYPSCRGPIVALAFFAATLSPMLGFFPLYTFYYSFVADHYQYLACLGLVALATAAIRGCVKWEVRRATFRAALAATILTLLGVLTWQQTWIYQTPETLWRDTLKKNPASWLAHNNLGLLLAARADRSEAEAHYRAALELNPEEGDIHYNLGNLLVATGRSGEAVAHYEKALSFNPTDADLHNNLAVALYSQHQTQQAILHLREVLRYRPASPDAHYNLAIALESEHQFQEARKEYEEVLRLRPDSTAAQSRLRALQGR